jgi:phosphoenolpyruvate carboxylase
MRSFLNAEPEAFGLSQPLSDDLRTLDRILGKVLSAQEGEEIIDAARKLAAGEETSPETLLQDFPSLKDPSRLRALARAFTAFFQLANTAEQKEIVRVNRERQRDRRESIRDAIQQLHRAGRTAEEVQELLNRIQITPTLTAHPTEAKRKAVLDKLQRIATLLAEHASGPNLTERLEVNDSALDEIEQTLTTLWQTDEMRASRLTVDEEVRNALYFFDRTIMEVLPWLHEDLEDALEESFPGHRFELPPFLTYRSWVGGDRDGNPSVTPEVTWQTLLAHRTQALETYLPRVIALRDELTQSQKLVGCSPELDEAVQGVRERRLLSKTQLDRYSQEPYVLLLREAEERLRQTLAGGPNAYTNEEELLTTLRVVRDSLAGNRAEALSRRGNVARLIRQIEAFGFHLAALDVRQHSDERLDLLTRELHNPRPLLPPGYESTDEVRHVLDVFHIIRRARRELSERTITTYVISMTHGVSDLLEVLLFCKEAGLLRVMPDGSMRSEIDVVPLFETITDLHSAGELAKK